VLHHPNEPVKNHLKHNLEKVSYGVWHELKLLTLLPKNEKYYLQKESKHLVTHHLLHFLPNFSLVVHFFVSLEIYNLPLDVIYFQNSITLSFLVFIWIFSSYNSHGSLGAFLYPFVFPRSPRLTHYLMSHLSFSITLFH
jgi:hypothetical protein